MSPRNSNNSKVSGIGSTEFQLHKSQYTKFTGIMHKIFDYSEFRLTRYLETVKDYQKKAILSDILAKYKRGFIAIAWKRGEPIWLPVTKDA